jgi:hypothetical protein
MRKLITAVMVAALLASGAAPSALARGGQRHSGIWHGSTYHTSNYFKHRPYYGYRHRRHYGFWRPYRTRHHGYGGGYYFHGDAAVVLGVLAGAVVLGALLSRPAPPRPRAPVLRSPSGAPLGGCLQTTGTGTWYGRPAHFSGTMCYDPAGRAYVLPGSERFVGYLR